MMSYSNGKTILSLEESMEVHATAISDMALSKVFAKEQTETRKEMERKQRLQNFTTNLRIIFYNRNDRVPTFEEMEQIKAQAMETFNIMESMES